jgi:hypothetical protein
MAAMMLFPVLRFEAGGEQRSLWLGTRETLSIELGEKALEHALAEARRLHATDMRIEFIEAGDAGRCALRVHVPQ